VMWDAQSPSTSPSPGPNLAVFQPGSQGQSWTAPAVTTSTSYPYYCCIHGPQMSSTIVVTP
jgi:hypothetical protein